MAGIAGALYVPQVGIINPGEFAPANSIEAVIWVAVGGRGTLAGAALGAILVNAGKTLVHRRAARILALRARAACSCSSTLFLPKGIVGIDFRALADGAATAGAPRLPRRPPPPRPAE